MRKAQLRGRSAVRTDLTPSTCAQEQEPGHGEDTGGGGPGACPSHDAHPQPHHPRREQSSMTEHSPKRAVPSFFAGKSLWQPLERQISLQLVLITLTSSRACCGGVPLHRAALPADVTPLCYLPGWGCMGRGALLPQQGEPPPARPQAAIVFLPLPGSLWAALGLGLPPGHCQRSFQYLEIHPGGGRTLPSPLTWNPDGPGFYVCRAFGKQNA